MSRSRSSNRRDAGESSRRSVSKGGRPATKGSRSASTASRNASSAIAMLLVLVIVSAMVVYGIMSAKRNEKQPETSAPVAQEEADPFAGMTYAYGDQKAKPRTTGRMSSDTIDNYESASAEWTRARELQRRAAELIDEATVLRADGDFAYKAKNSTAMDLMDEAYEIGAAWREVLIAEQGEDSAEVASLNRTLQNWNRTRLMLHKTGG